jgi:predicted dehydrogenase
MTDRVRIGIIGCGEVAQIIHLPALRDLRDRFAVTALCDISAVVREGVGEIWNIPRRFADFQELVSCPEVDAVLVANPHVLHTETALAAMAAGKHVLIEKPLCVAPADADALIAGRDRTGVVAQVGYMRRHAPAFLVARELVQGLDDIRLARVHDVLGRNALFIAPTTNVVRPTDLMPEVGVQLAAALAAATEAAIGKTSLELAGAYSLLLGLSSHDLSAMRELLGPPHRVLYAAHRGERGQALSAAFDYGGFVCNFESTIDLIPRFDAHIEVYSPTRVIRVEYDTPYIRNLPGRVVVTSVDERGQARVSTTSAWRDPFVMEWEAFHAAVTSGAPVKTTLEDAHLDLQLFHDMIAAMRVAAPK